MRSDSIPIIFGIKLKELREQAGLSATELAQRAGLSVSYLTEIEKGRKYPKTEKIFQLAEALGANFDDLVSLKLGQRLNPLATLLDSPMFRDLPLKLFGISQSDIFELMTRAPVEVATLVQTLVELARGYDMGVEQFFHALLRSYQQAHDNYFDDLETLARECTQELDIAPGGDGLAKLCEVLEHEHGVQVHAIYEPKQESTSDDIVLVDDPEGDEKLAKVAGMLSLVRVGVMIGHPAREYVFSVNEIMLASRLHAAAVGNHSGERRVSVSDAIAFRKEDMLILGLLFTLLRWKHSPIHIPAIRPLDKVDVP